MRCRQIAFGTAAEDFADAVVHVNQFPVLDDGQSLLDVVGQVAETFLVQAGGGFGLLVLRHLQGEFHVQARQFVLVGAGAFFEFAVELQEVRFEAGEGGESAWRKQKPAERQGRNRARWRESRTGKTKSSRWTAGRTGVESPRRATVQQAMKVR